MTKIINYRTKETIIEDENLSIRELVEKAVKNNIFLVYADFEDANLWGANLWDADLRGANLWGANLWDADLRGADLRGANLWGANFRGAFLGGIKINKNQVHDLLKALGVKII